MDLANNPTVKANRRKLRAMFYLNKVDPKTYPLCISPARFPIKDSLSGVKRNIFGWVTVLRQEEGTYSNEVEVVHLFGGTDYESNGDRPFVSSGDRPTVRQ